MFALERLVNCVLYLARSVFVLIGLPYRFIWAMANFVAGTSAFRDSDNSATVEDSRNKSPNTNDNNAKSGNIHDSDSDSCSCDYDSTWVEEVDQKVTTKTKKKKHTQWWNRRNTRAAKDMQTYRHDYPEEEDPPPCQIFPHHPNLKFYKNEMKSQPDDVSIEDYHTKWLGDYSSLERVHTFIQWLFPIREDGVNFQAYKLTKDEIEAFKADQMAKERLRKSYELMLDFYGIKLVNQETGEVQRADNWKDRFYNLNKYAHNNLRITRILKCLGTLGFAHYQAPLVRFFLKETLENGQLWNVRRSVLDYFLFSVLDKEQRKELIREAFFMFQKSQGDGMNGDKFVWCPKWVQKKFQEELNSKKTGKNKTNQSFGSVDETQSTTEGGPYEQNKPKLEEEVGLNADMRTNVKSSPDSQIANKESISDVTLDSEPSGSKHSDENEENSASKENQHSQVAEGGLEVQSDTNDQQQGQNANKPEAMATNDSSVTGCSIKTPDLTSVSQDRLRDSPTGPLQTSDKTKEIENGLKQETDIDTNMDELAELPEEKSQSGDDQSVHNLPAVSVVDQTSTGEGSEGQCCQNEVQCFAESTQLPKNDPIESQQTPPEN